MTITWIKKGWCQLFLAIRSWAIVNQLANLEFVRKSKRSRIGHWWSAINTGILILILSVVFGSIFKLPNEYFLPYLSIGLIIWFHINTVLVSASGLYPENRELILQIALPRLVYVFQLWLRESIALRYNLMIIPVVLLIVQINLSVEMMYSILGLILLELNLLWMIIFIAMISVRYRDVRQILINVLQFGFYSTPIIWERSLLELSHLDNLIVFNPFFHLIEGVRAPLLDTATPWLSYAVAGGLALFGWLCALYVHGRFHKRIEYWV